MCVCVRVVQVDPSKRIRLEDIMQDAWFAMYLPDPGSIKPLPPATKQNGRQVHRLWIAGAVTYLK